MQLLAAPVDGSTTSTTFPTEDTTGRDQAVVAAPQAAVLADGPGSSALARASVGGSEPAGANDGLLLATTAGAALALTGTAWEAQRRRRVQAAVAAGRARGRRAAR